MPKSPISPISPNSPIKSKTTMQKNTKDWLQYGSAIGMLTSGVLLTFLCFFLNGHDVTDGVLWYVGQTLVYAGSIFGVGIYINSRIASISSKPKTDQPDDSPKDTPDR